MQLKELAQLCGVSLSTVSRVLNGYSENFSVKPEIRERIIRTASEVGFRPNPVYKALRSRKNNLVSVLFPQTDNRYSDGPSLDTVSVMADVFFRKGYSFNSFYSPADAALDARGESYYYPSFQKAGAYVLPDVSMKTQLQYVDGITEPVLVLNGIAEGMKWDTVNCDEKANMHIIVEYLHELGHKRIFYANTSPDNPMHYSVKDRAEGYLDACADFGLGVLNGFDIRVDEAQGLLDMALDQHATAAICYNHYIAYEMILQAWERGIKVPDTLSVITFNNNRLMDYSVPPLTCLEPPSTKMGERAAEILLGRINMDPAMSREPLFEQYSGKVIARRSVANINNAR